MNAQIENIILQMPAHKMQLATELREIILAASPGVEEIIKWTRVTFVAGKNDIAFICSCSGKDYIELGFFKATYLTDLLNLFEVKGKAKEIRRIKIHSSETIPAKQIQNWVRQAELLTISPDRTEILLSVLPLSVR